MGAGRKCRYSGVRRAIGGIRGHWGILRGVGVLWAIRWHVRECRGCPGVYGAGRECRYSGARRGVGSIRGIGVS